MLTEILTTLYSELIFLVLGGLAIYRLRPLYRKYCDPASYEYQSRIERHQAEWLQHLSSGNAMHPIHPVSFLDEAEKIRTEAKVRGEE
jgi:hypothetical protein